jgi:hypothetical protein
MRGNQSSDAHTLESHCTGKLQKEEVVSVSAPWLEQVS